MQEAIRQEVIAAMREEIRKIVEPIKSGLFFDSHFVIDQLIKGPTDIYLNYARANAKQNVALLHGNISLTIGQQVDLVASPGRSWSMNIHGSPGECEAWRRI